MADKTFRQMLGEAEKLRDWFLTSQGAVDTIRAAIAAEDAIAAQAQREAQFEAKMAEWKRREAAIISDISAYENSRANARTAAANEQQQLEASLAPLREEAQGLEARIAQANDELEALRRKVG